MSKSDDAKNRFSEYEEFFNYFARSLADFGKTVETMSNTLENSLKGVLEREVPIKNAERMSTTEVNKFWAKIEEVLKELGIELGKEGKKFIKHFKDISVSQAKSEQGLSVNNLQNKVSNVAIPQLFIKQMKGLAKGDNDSFIKNFSDNKLAKTIANETVEKLKIGNEFNTFDYKIRAFFGTHFAENKKNLQAFGKNLIEGLAASKFVGGAITDGIKLLGLLGNNWLSDKGPVGQILGKILVVLTQATASILSSSFLSSLLGAAIGGRISGVIGKGFTKGFTALKGLFGKGAGGLFGKGALAFGGLFGPKIMTTQMARSTLSAGSIFRDSATGKLRKVVEGAVKADGTKSLRTVAIKEGASKGLIKGLGKGAGKTLLKKIPGLGLLAGGAFAAGRAMHGDWGGAGLELLSGLASLVPGYGTAASLAIDGALMTKDMGLWGKKGVKGTVKGGTPKGNIPKGGKLGGYAIGAGAVLGGSGILLVSLFNLLKNYFNDQKKDKEESKSFWQDFVSAFKNSRLGKMLGFGDSTGFGGGSNSSGGSTSFGERVSNVISGFSDTKLGRYAGIQDLNAVRKIGNLGINKYGQMTNIRSMTQNQASDAIQAYMKQDRASFDKNYEILDSKYASFGAYKNDAVIKDSKGKIIGVLAGKGTKARIDKYRKNARKAGVPESVVNQVLATGGLSTKTSPHKAGGAYSHDELGANSLDLAIPRGKYAETIYNVIRDSSREDGFDAKWEGYNNDGSFYFKNKYKSGLSKAHIDMKKLKGYNAVAEQHSIEAEAIYAKMAMNRAFDEGKGAKAGEELYEKAKAGASGSAEDISKYYEKMLKDYNVQYDKNKNIWVQTDAKGNKSQIEVIQVDPDGNKDFRDAMINISKIANVGV